MIGTILIIIRQALNVGTIVYETVDRLSNFLAEDTIQITELEEPSSFQMIGLKFRLSVASPAPRKDDVDYRYLLSSSVGFFFFFSLSLFIPRLYRYLVGNLTSIALSFLGVSDTAINLSSNDPKF